MQRQMGAVQIRMNFNKDAQLDHISLFVRGKRIIQNKYSTMTDSVYLEFSEFHMKFPRTKLSNFPAAHFLQLEEWMKIDVQISVKAEHVPCTAQEKQKNLWDFCLLVFLY